jgi:hypothetical protein
VSTRVDDDSSVVAVVNSTDHGGAPHEAGIGLTIVEAVSVAHGGRLVWNRPADDEVRAEIWLPRRS